MAGKLIIIVLVALFSYAWKIYINDGCVYESTKSLEGRTVILTGGNAGIGKATAMELAKRKAHLIIASRNVKKSLVVREEIIRETGHDDIQVMKLDLGDLDSVAEFAKKILENEEYVDYLVNNGGIFAQKGATKQGFGVVFAVNHLGPFLLTNLLLSNMKKQSVSRPVRIINVSSCLHEKGTIDFSNLHDEKFIEGFEENVKEYGTTKLANIYFTSALKSKLEGFDISSFSVHPGWIKNTELGRYFNYNWFEQIMLYLMSTISFRSPFYGSQPIMKCILDDNIFQYNGGYFSECEHTELDSAFSDGAVAEQLWEESTKLVKPWLDNHM